ncbi:hypothetical protein VNO77_49251 [Canavalia gladiata]|uniref:Uncharacterized protein n=1 Tax=Canavalia gladiata TaxID=3824 RepID=A0AAN9PF78_CANGL
MTPIRVRSGHPNHELNDLSCFDRWFTARANKPTISRGGLRSKVKALSNLIHLFRASGCPSLPIDDSASPRATRWDTSTWAINSIPVGRFVPFHWEQLRSLKKQTLNKPGLLVQAEILGIILPLLLGVFLVLAERKVIAFVQRKKAEGAKWTHLFPAGALGKVIVRALFLVVYLCLLVSPLQSIGMRGQYDPLSQVGLLPVNQVGFENPVEEIDQDEIWREVAQLEQPAPVVPANPAPGLIHYVPGEFEVPPIIQASRENSLFRRLRKLIFEQSIFVTSDEIEDVQNSLRSAPSHGDYVRLLDFWCSNARIQEQRHDCANHLKHIFPLIPQSSRSVILFGGVYTREALLLLEYFYRVLRRRFLFFVFYHSVPFLLSLPSPATDHAQHQSIYRRIAFATPTLGPASFSWYAQVTLSLSARLAWWAGKATSLSYVWRSQAFPYSSSISQPMLPFVPSRHEA